MYGIVYFVLASIPYDLCWAQDSTKKCSYEFLTKSDTVRISCSEGAVLNIRDQFGNLLLSSETERKSDRPIILQLNTSSVTTIRDEGEKAMEKLKDAAVLLRKSRERMSSQINKLNNLTTLLQKGDSELKRDLDTLREKDLSSPLVRESIIAAIQNQYNFVRMGLLTQNAQLTELISATVTLTTSILKTARASLSQAGLTDVRFDLLNQTLQNISNMMPGGFGKGIFFGEHTVFCPQELVSISKVGTIVVIGTEQGAVMRDPFTIDKMWVTFGYTDINQITEYNSLKDLKFELVGKTYELPFFCIGTGHVVFKKALFCQKMFTSKIVKYDLAQNRWMGERQLENVGVHNTYPYQSGKFSDIDFAVDELGLWMVYATNESKGNIVISKINPDDLSFEQTWITEIPKRSVGNTFMICGILYATDSYEQIPTYIKYMYDTNTVKEKILTEKQLPFRNSLKSEYARVYTLDYSPADRVLYSWNHGHVEIFPVSFSREDEP
ncbi:hypothetical protein ACJMK2_012007 [Sinanodonta woodiana]|uniref:Olfactomedin-like domain-containing protein n=1 Tax=Sinanodonta woodiana TaxID=1069815 RepID=A0ABD3V6U7_SINWO